MSEPLMLTGLQKEILREGIVRAYPDPDNLWILLAVRMEVQVSAITRGDTYEIKVFNLIQDFETDGRIEEFIRVVVKDKPRSPALEDVKKEFASILGEDSPKEITYDHPIKQNQERKPTQNNKSLVPKMHILHLSDLHFGTPDQAQIWSNQLVQDLRNELNIASLDALILSGDIANKSTESEYEAARKFLDYFRQDFPLEPEQIIIIPGNHDLNWEKSEDAYTPVKRKDYNGSTILLNGEKRADSNHAIDDGGRFIEQQDEDEYRERFFYFSQFYQSIKGTPYPKDYEEQYTITPFPSKKLLILGLNSAWQLDHHYKERASINMNALSNALPEIRRNSEYDNFLKIAVWHHPLDSTGNDRMTDQGFMEQLAVAGFRFFLHGHIHQAETNIYRYDMSANGRKLDRICAGTFGASTRELVSAYPWQYNLLKFEPNLLTVEPRRREKENGAWKPDARWNQGAGKDPLPRYTIAIPEYALEPIKK